jgi:VCBS repeat-containing protein
MVRRRDLDVDPHEPDAAKDGAAERVIFLASRQGWIFRRERPDDADKQGRPFPVLRSRRNDSQISIAPRHQSRRNDRNGYEAIATRTKRMRLKLPALLSLLAATLSAAGCGGGGDKAPVPPPNHPPVVVTTPGTIDEDTALTTTVTATDSDNDAVTFALVTGAAHGTATVTATGSVAYTPAPNYSGADSFVVGAADGKGGQGTGTVPVTVRPINDAPVLTTAAITTTEDTLLSGQIAVTDPDNDPHTFTVETTSTHGTLTLQPNGSFTYGPASNFNGADSFSVHVSDGAGGETNGTVAITVTAVNDLPQITSTQFIVLEDGVLDAQLTAQDADGDAVQFDYVPGNPRGNITADPSGHFTYAPAPNVAGNDLLSFRARDASGTQVAQTVEIVITPVNDPPVASDDEFRLPAAAVVTLPILANDVDADGETLQVTFLTQPGGGTLAVSPSNQVTFTPDHDFNGPIRFRYRVSDAAGTTSDADVRAVIGDFAGLYYLSDETTVGKAELQKFDGLHVARISGNRAADETITSFSVSGDGARIAFVVETDSFDRVYAGVPGDVPQLVHTGSNKPPGSPLHTTVELNRDGTYLRVNDPYIAPGGRVYLVRVSAGIPTQVSGVGLTAPGNYFAFSPANDDIYLQGDAGGFLTLFHGTVDSPSLLAQAGSNYPTPANGGGSGMEVVVTADGRYAVHQELTFSPTRSAVLVYDSVLDTEAPMYRRPGAGEIGMWDGFALSNDGKHVCFQFREPGGGSFGPSRFIVGDPASPASAVPVTPVTTGGYKCYFGTDDRTLFYIAQTAAAPTLQMYRVDSAAPGAPVLVNRPFVSGETLEDFWVARDAMRVVLGTRGSGPADVSYYSVDLAAPTTFIPFANTFDDGSLPGQIDAGGLLLAYAKRPAPLTGLRRLTLLSTQSSTYSLPLTRADSTTGVVQFQWLP